MIRQGLYISILSALGLFFFNEIKIKNAISSQPNLQLDLNSFSERVEWDLMRLSDPSTGKIPTGIRYDELSFSNSLPKNNSEYFGKSSAASTWNKRGPWNVGGRTRAFAIDHTNENILLAGTTSGGMWRSTDGGVNWTRVSSIDGHQGNTCIAQDKRPGKEHIWYYGTGEAYGNSAGFPNSYYLGNGVFQSIDSGKTWNVLPSTSSNTPQSFDHFGDLTWNIALDHTDTTQDIIYLAGLGAIYRSINGGTSWNIAKGTSASGNYSFFTDIHITPNGILYATLSSKGTQKGIYRSLDGVAWTNITPTNFPTTYDRIVITSAPSDESQVYFLGHTPGFGKADTTFHGDVVWHSFWKYKYLSGDGSDTGGGWWNLSQNLPSTGGPLDKYNSQGSYNITLKVKPNDTNIVFIGGTNLYRSTNAFKDSLNTRLIGGYKEGTNRPVIELYAGHHPDNHALEFLPSDPNTLYSTHDGGISVTSNNLQDTVQWTSLNNGYITSMFYTVAIDHAVSNNDVVVGGTQDNGSWYTNTTNITSPWVFTRGGDGSYCAVADSQKMYYFSSQNAKIIKADLDVAGNNLGFSRIDPIGGKDYLFINPFTLDPNDNNIMYLAGGRSIWRNDSLNSIALNNTWDSITTGWIKLPDTVPGTRKISALVACKTPANRIYYGTSQQKVYRIDNANSGSPILKEITNLSGGAVFPSGYVSCVAVDPRNGDHLIVAFSNYNVYSMYYSNDGGNTWDKIAGNLEQNVTGTGNGPSIRWVSILPVSNGTVYLAATTTGVYATDYLNSLNTVWVKQGIQTIGDAVCDMIDVRLSDGKVAVATHSNGIFTTNITSTLDIVGTKEYVFQEPQITIETYPNPFRGEFTFKTNLENAGIYSLSLFDMAGRKVHTCFSNRNINAGSTLHSLTMSTHIAKGNYNLVLEGNNLLKTQKVVVY